MNFRYWSGGIESKGRLSLCPPPPASHPCAVHNGDETGRPQLKVPLGKQEWKIHNN
ncbi:rCG61525 [Rattus norvegicus]|uniref:RCG61525 n=1 Tax=Rattus norvegicus TaxID=10116 RepID=A6H9K3_RAT|nr:rCG61525 [Rattus norvegicus]